MNQEETKIDKPKKKHTFIRSIANFLVYVLIVGGVIFGLPRALSALLHTPYPMAAITSGSMWPALKEGDLVFIEGVGKDDVNVGDIVVFRNATGPGFTIHRIIELNENTFVTKGDANFKDDDPIRYENLVGRTLSVFGGPTRLPYLGFVTVYATKK